LFTALVECTPQREGKFGTFYLNRENGDIRNKQEMGGKREVDKRETTVGGGGFKDKEPKFGA
jgi:hypothetical protein